MKNPAKTPTVNSELLESQHTPATVSKCIVLLSGGQDSTTCLWMAKTRFQEVHAVSFNYGQRHEVELDQALAISEIAKCSSHKIFDIRGLLSGSAQTDHSLDVNAAHAQNPSLPATFTAGRNALFLTLAASYGHGLGIQDIYTGVCETDGSGYPDCREMFINSQTWALRLALDNDYLSIHTPLMHLDKSRIWKAAVDLGCFDIVRNLTLTDYNGNLTRNAWGMGAINNPASELRAKGFVEAFERGWIPQDKLSTWREPEFQTGWTPEREIQEVKDQLNMWSWIKEAKDFGIADDAVYMQVEYCKFRSNGASEQDALTLAREMASGEIFEANSPEEAFGASNVPEGIFIAKMDISFGGPEIHDLLEGKTRESNPDLFNKLDEAFGDDDSEAWDASAKDQLPY